jgi:NADPH:quinone reductase-like Zn-dependent oxidoreductase
MNTLRKPHSTTFAIPLKMRAIAMDHYGGAEELKLHQLPVPKLGPDEVLIKVEFAGVGRWDATERSGAMVQITPNAVKKFPRILGAEGAGTIAAIGADVTDFRTGDKIYASGYLNPKGGFYAEYTAVPANLVAPVPGGLPMDQAAVLALTGITALRGLSDHLALKPSQNLLIFGAAGGVGLPAVQLAKAMGVHVLAVVSTADDATIVRASGADVAVNSTTDDLPAAMASFAPDGLDGVLALTNKDGLDKAIAAVRAGGRVAYPNGVRPVPARRPGVEVIGYDGSPDRAAIDKLNSLIEVRPFSVRISESFTLADASQAHRELMNHHSGRIPPAIALHHRHSDRSVRAKS